MSNHSTTTGLPEGKREQSHSEQQAWAQLESISEMVAKLTRNGAAQEYVKELSRDKLLALMDVEEDPTDETDDELRETVANLIVSEMVEPGDFEFDEEAAQQTIQEDPLSVQVRSDWYNPGDEEGAKASEFEILLCTGGPAVRIRGDLDEHGHPDRAYIEHQDWGTPWTQLFNLSDEQQEALLAYCQQFYFGEGR